MLRCQRGILLANDTRFLILPDAGYVPNLASRMLALNLRCLSAEWQCVGSRAYHPRSNSGLKNRPVCELGSAATCSGVPMAMT